MVVFLSFSYFTCTDENRSLVHGALHAIRRDPAFGTLVCDTDVTTYVIEGEDLRAAVFSSPKLAEEMIYGLSREVRLYSKAMRTPLFEQTSSTKLPIFATSVAASIECFYRSFMGSLMMELLTGKKTPRFPIMHIQMPTRIFYINGFKGIRFYLDHHVNADAYSNPKLARLLMAVTPGVIMTPVSSILEASNAGQHNPEPIYRRLFRGIIPRCAREVIFGVGLNQLTDFFEERVPEGLVTNPVYRNMLGSLCAGMASGYISHFPHNLSTLKLTNPHKTYMEHWADIGKKAEDRLPAFLRNRGNFTTWCGRISTIIAPATVTVRTGQICGSFIILNGVITFINTRSETSVSGPK